MANQRLYSSEVLYCSKTKGWTTTSRWADNLQQAIGFTKWYVQEINRQGGEIREAQAIVQDCFGHTLTLVEVEPVFKDYYTLTGFTLNIQNFTPEGDQK